MTVTEKYKIDDIDRKILAILKRNARIQWREIGEEIHMTGQAVGERIKKLMTKGIIRGYHADIDLSIINDITINYITVILVSGNHRGFLELVSSMLNVTEVYKTSGYGCYLLRVETDNNDALESVLQNIMPYGNYRVSTVFSKHK